MFCLFTIKLIVFLLVLLNEVNCNSNIVIANVFLFHFGMELSEWVDIWLYFVKYQHYIKYTIITDKLESDFKHESLPNNVKVLTTSLLNISEKARLILNMNEPLTISQPYKLCDYRILFGILFKNELDFGCNDNKCQYWGWSDFDSIVGNIFDTSFFPLLTSNTNNMLAEYLQHYNKYDIIATNNIIPTNGPFALLKYNNMTIHLYKLVASYSSSLTIQKPALIDEIGMKHAIAFQEKIQRLKMYTPPQDMTCKNQWLWYNGTLYDLKRVTRPRCAYFHYGGGTGMLYTMSMYICVSDGIYI